MSLRIGDTAPDFQADTTAGTIKFHEWLGDSWGVLFSHPKDFTPVCTTELGYMAKLKPEFDKRNVKVIGLSVDPVDAHSKWSDDIKETQGHAPNYPMIGDPELKVAKAWGMLPAELTGGSQGRTAADNQTVRNVFVVGPDKKIKLILVYPMTTGRNFDEVLRVIDSLQLTAKHKVATPVNWKQGEDVIIAGFGLGRRREEDVPGRLEGAAAVHPDRSAAAVVGLVPRTRLPAKARERDGALHEAHALSPQQLRLQLVVPEGVGAQADLAGGVHDPVPGDVAVGGERVQRVSDEPRLARQPRQHRDLAVGGDAPLRDARHHRIDPPISIRAWRHGG